LRTLFFLEETDNALAELREMQPTLREELEELYGEHPQLLEVLEQIQELAGSAVRPASTWDDVESRFHRFQRALSRHQRRHDDLRERVAVLVVDE
jgi:predicted RNase H-like nuclease (RuvC/YqgF family)